LSALLGTPREAAELGVSHTHHADESHMPPRKGSFDFALRAAPFLFMLSFGSWGLSQFLKLPTQLKDDRAKRRKQGREKFDLAKENENLKTNLQDKSSNYENVRVPGPRPAGRVAAD